MPVEAELILYMPLEDAFTREVIALGPVVVRADEIAGDRAVVVGVSLVKSAGSLVREDVEFLRNTSMKNPASTCSPPRIVTATIRFPCIATRSRYWQNLTGTRAAATIRFIISSAT